MYQDQLIEAAKSQAEIFNIEIDNNQITSYINWWKEFSEEYGHSPSIKQIQQALTLASRNEL